MNTTDSNIQTVLKIFEVLEQREPSGHTVERLLELCQTDVEICWPPSLPYGGTSRGLVQVHPSWTDAWDPLQPTQVERQMSPRVIAANGRNEVGVVYRQRGLNCRGEHFETEVLGLYELRDGKLARAQMFYFDEAGTNRFLTESTREDL